MTAVRSAGRAISTALRSRFSHSRLDEKMPSGQDNGQSTSSRSSSLSFEKQSRGSRDYPLEILDAVDDRPGRQSVDLEGEPVDEHNEPLLPTSDSVRDVHVGARPKRCSCSPSGIIAWAKGPAKPHRYHIDPWLYRWQTAPERFIERHVPSRTRKICLLLAVVLIWGALFISTVHSAVAGLDVAGFGNPVKLSCHAKLW